MRSIVPPAAAFLALAFAVTLPVSHGKEEKKTKKGKGEKKESSGGGMTYEQAVEESAGLGKPDGWGCCNCADCFSGTGGCSNSLQGCCMPQGPFCCNADIYPARHRDFCREEHNKAKAIGKQISCDVCEKVSKKVAKMFKANHRAIKDEGELIEELMEICEGKRGSRADPERWKHLPLEQARRAGAMDARANTGDNSVDKVLMFEGWEVKGDESGGFKLQRNPDFGKFGCMSQGESVRECGACDSQQPCEDGQCMWVPPTMRTAGRCQTRPDKVNIRANFTLIDSMKEACRVTLVDYGSDLAEWLYLQGKKNKATEAGDIAQKLCTELSGACKQPKKRRAKGSGEL